MSTAQVSLVEDETVQVVSFLRMLSAPQAQSLAHMLSTRLSLAKATQAQENWQEHVDSCVECTGALFIANGWVDNLCSVGKTLRQELTVRKAMTESKD